MSGFLLDTNVLSEIVKPVPHPDVVRWFEEHDESAIFLSVLTLGEIRKGIAQLTEGSRKTRLDQWLTRDLLPRFRGRILPVDEEVADRWGRLQALARELGRILPVIDGLLMATALHRNLVFVTRNTKDIEFAAVSFFNPWQHTP